jgi:tryptophan halogenase
MNIVIVGGGTAGWLAALIISKVFKEQHKITLIESESIGTIGVGEGSTGFLRGIMNNEVWDYGCNEFDFMKEARATPKLGILFKDWQNINTEYMEPIDPPEESGLLGSNALLSLLQSKELDISLSSLNGRLMSEEKSGFINDQGKIKKNANHAYHFDSKGAAKYFEKVCSGSIKKINGEIKDITLDNNGCVVSVVLSSGEAIKGDFFIDASGFARIFSKKMDVKFIEYKELTLNSAIPFRLDYSHFDKTFFYTTSWAQKFGWMWMIPTSDSVGCGYIYDDRYIDEHQAKKEIEEKLGIEIEVIKNIKFTPGRLEKVWNKNVLSIGLSSNFLEPLEATSIHGTIAQLNTFVYLYLNNSLEETVTEDKQNIYNEQTAKMVDSFRDFILAHYAGTREDTDFWKKMNESALKNNEIKKMLSISKTRLLSGSDLNYVYGSPPYDIFNWVLCGLDHFSKETATKEVELINRKNAAQFNEFYLKKYMLNNNWINNEDFMKYLVGEKLEK